MKEIKVHEKYFNKEWNDSYVVYEVKPNFYINASVEIEDYDTEYEPTEKENGYVLHQGGYYVERVYTNVELVDGDGGYYIGYDDVSRSEFMQKIGMTEAELAEVEEFIKKNAHELCEGWAIDNPDKVIGN